MKKSLLFATALSAGLYAHAQQNTRPFLQHSVNPEHRDFVSRLLQRQTAAQKPTGTQQRVIAQVYQDLGDTDSTHFQYSGTRGSRYNYNTQDFAYNSGPISAYIPMVSQPGMPNTMDMLADTIASYYGGALYMLTDAWYRNDNKTDSFRNMYVDGTDISYDKTLHTFYPGSYLHTVENGFSDDGVNFSSGQIRKISYNSSFNQMTHDSTFVDFGSGLELFLIAHYHYNTQGQADSILTGIYNGVDTDPFSTTVMTYDPSGRVTKVATYNNLNGDFLMDLDSLSYTNGIDYFTSWTYVHFDENGLVDGGSRMEKTPGSNGLPGDVQLYSWDTNTWMEDVNIHYTYNAQGNPDLLTGTLDGNPAGTLQFYYEEYDDGLSIKPLAAHKNLRIYPNPFRNSLSIDWKGKEQSKVTIRLVNMTGQEVYKTAATLNAGANALQIPEVGSGNYVLLLQDASGKCWSSKLVKK